MENPKVSIITVCFNAEAFIKRTILSVTEQTYSEIEYLVIDGASTDKTAAIIKKYENSIDFWISEPDRSHFDAMNKGLQRSTGDYILYMNAGDTLKDRFSLEKLMRGCKDADLYYGLAQYIDESGKKWPWHKMTPKPEKLNSESFIYGMVICHHCMVVRRVLAPYYNLDPWKVSNDLDWAIRVMKKVKTKCFYDDVFCLYLSGGISNKFMWIAVRERFNICIRHFGLIKTIFAQLNIVLHLIRRILKS